jgi:hypothetical protein
MLGHLESVRPRQLFRPWQGSRLVWFVRHLAELSVRAGLGADGTAEQQEPEMVEGDLNVPFVGRLAFCTWLPACKLMEASQSQQPSSGTGRAAL